MPQQEAEDVNGVVVADEFLQRVHAALAGVQQLAHEHHQLVRQTHGARRLLLLLRNHVPAVRGHRALVLALGVLHRAEGERKNNAERDSGRRTGPSWTVAKQRFREKKEERRGCAERKCKTGKT